MTRRTLIPILILLAGCGKRQRPGEISLPAAVDGGWTLQSTGKLPNESAPEAARQLGVMETMEGHYTGPSNIRVIVYRMPTETVAFELIQKWRPEPGTLLFHTGPYLVVIALEEGEGDRKQLDTFAKGFERALGA